MQSRYYDPEIARFINADAYASTDQGVLGNNMFAYCGNNSANYADPSGNQFGPTGSHIKATYFLAPGQRGTALAQLQREGRHADIDPLVIDFSCSFMIPGAPVFLKFGIAIVIDFSEVEVSLYPHSGYGFGISCGLGLSVGLVDNYKAPTDYAEHFYDTNGCLFVGIDHCWDPRVNHDSSTKATSIIFGTGFGFGYDYYWGPY